MDKNQNFGLGGTATSENLRELWGGWPNDNEVLFYNHRMRFLLRLIATIVQGIILGLWGGLIVPIFLFPVSSEWGALVGALWVIGFHLSAWLGVVGVHELGHWLAGRLVGFKFRFIVIGPWMLVRQLDGLHVRWRAEFQGGLYSAAILNGNYTPESLRGRLRAMILGGPLINLAQGLLALAWLISVPALPLTGQLWLGLIGWLALEAAIYNLFPFTVRGLASDGQMLRLLQSAEAEDYLQAIQLQRLIWQGRRPREWSRPTLETLHTRPKFSAYYAYIHALDQQRPGRAAVWLERALDLQPFGEGGRELALEAAFFEAHFRHAPARARQWLTYAHGSAALTDQASARRAQAALALAEGDPQRALHHIQAGIAALPHSLDWGLARLNHAWLRQLNLHTHNLPRATAQTTKSSWNQKLGDTLRAVGHTLWNNARDWKSGLLQLTSFSVSLTVMIFALLLTRFPTQPCTAEPLNNLACKAQAWSAWGLGWLAEEQHDWTMAQTWYTRALGTDPNFTFAYWSRAYTHSWVDSQAIIEDLNQAVATAVTPAIQSWMLQTRGQFLLTTFGTDKAAIKDFEAALALTTEPQQKIQLYRALADAHIQLGANLPAIAAYETALTINPQSAELHCELGLLYAAQAERYQALVHLQRGTRLDIYHTQPVCAAWLQALLTDSMR